MSNQHAHAMIVRLVDSRGHADIGTLTMAVYPGPAGLGEIVARALGRLFQLQPNLPIKHQLTVGENAKVIADMQHGRAARPLILEVTEVQIQPKAAADPTKAAGRAQASENKSLEQIADTLRAYGQHANGNDPRAYVQAIQRLGQGWQAASDTVRAIGLKLNLPETAGAAAFSAALHALIGELDAGKETIEIQAHDLDSLTLDRKSLADSLESVRSQLNALREHVRALEAERDQLRNRAGQTGQEPPPQPAPRKGRI